MSDIAKNIAIIKQNIIATNRPIKLLAVSKAKTVADIKSAFVAGQKDFGENYLQEALKKIQQLKDCNINWHFIGNIQSNKTKDIANNFHWVHSLDRLKIAKRLSGQRPDILPSLNICLQINIDNSPSKSGIHPKHLAQLIDEVTSLPRLKLRGLMAMPNLANANKSFTKMQTLFNQYPEFDTLSMGTSNDINLAIKYGATMLRIGEAIFGSR